MRRSSRVLSVIQGHELADQYAKRRVEIWGVRVPDTVASNDQALNACLKCGLE